MTSHITSRSTSSAVAAIIAAVILLILGTVSGAWPITAFGAVVLIGAIIVLRIAGNRGA